MDSGPSGYLVVGNGVLREFGEIIAKGGMVGLCILFVGAVLGGGYLLASFLLKVLWHYRNPIMNVVVWCLRPFLRLCDRVSKI